MKKTTTTTQIRKDAKGNVIEEVTTIVTEESVPDYQFPNEPWVNRPNYPGPWPLGQVYC